MRVFEDRQPLRIVLAGVEPLHADLTLFAKQSGQATVVVGLSDRPPPAGVDFWPVAGGDRPDLGAALETLAVQGIQRLLIEGGAALTAALLEAKLVDRFLLLTSPLVVGTNGLPASLGRSIEHSIAAAGLVPVDRRMLGADKLRTFARSA